MKTNPFAGKPAPRSILVDVAKLVTAYYAETPDAAIPAQRVAFGTSGQRGSSFHRSFNEQHILDITQAICLYRREQRIDGPLFFGHGYTRAFRPGAVQRAGGARGRRRRRDARRRRRVHPATFHFSCDSHPQSRANARARRWDCDFSLAKSAARWRFQIQPAKRGPAGTDITGWIKVRANGILEAGLKSVKRIPYGRALHASTTHRHNYLSTSVGDLGNVIDMEVIHASKINLGVDPLGRAGVRYWGPIAERYGLDLTVVRIQEEAQTIVSDALSAVLAPERKKCRAPTGVSSPDSVSAPNSMETLKGNS
jgi:phosphoglucomutase